MAVSALSTTKMDTDVDIKSIKGSPATLELRMNNIMTNIRSLSGKIRALTEKRDEMQQQYEELKQAKELKERRLVVKHSAEWDKGKASAVDSEFQFRY